MTKALYETGEKTVFLWDDHGKPIVARDAENLRTVTSTKMRYAQNFMQNGYFAGVRGALIAREKVDCPGFFTFLSGGTLTEAILHARQTDANNLHVQAMMRNGIPGVVIVATATPPDVLRYRTSDSKHVNNTTPDLFKC